MLLLVMNTRSNLLIWFPLPFKCIPDLCLFHVTDQCLSLIPRIPDIPDIPTLPLLSVG